MAKKDGILGKYKWHILGIAAILFSPLMGLITGAVYYSESKLKKMGLIIMAVSAILMALLVVAAVFYPELFGSALV